MGSTNQDHNDRCDDRPQQYAAPKRDHGSRWQRQLLRVLIHKSSLKGFARDGNQPKNHRLLRRRCVVFVKVRSGGVRAASTKKGRSSGVSAAAGIRLQRVNNESVPAPQTNPSQRLDARIPPAPLWHLRPWSLRRRYPRRVLTAQYAACAAATASVSTPAAIRVGPASLPIVPSVPVCIRSPSILVDPSPSVPAPSERYTKYWPLY